MSTSDFTIFDPHNPKLQQEYVSKNFNEFIKKIMLPYTTNDSITSDEAANILAQMIEIRMKDLHVTSKTKDFIKNFKEFVKKDIDMGGIMNVKKTEGDTRTRGGVGDEIFGYTNLLKDYFSYSTLPAGTSRGVFEYVNPEAQCNNVLKKKKMELDSAEGKKALQENQPAKDLANNPNICYLCGTVMENGVQDMECEHILPILAAASNLYIYNTKLKEYLADQTLFDAKKTMSQILNLEYAWSHQCCNQLKSDFNFLIMSNYQLEENANSLVEQRKLYDVDEVNIGAFFVQLRNQKTKVQEMLNGKKGISIVNGCEDNGIFPDFPNNKLGEEILTAKVQQISEHIKIVKDKLKTKIESDFAKVHGAEKKQPTLNDAETSICYNMFIKYKLLMLAISDDKFKKLIEQNFPATTTADKSEDEIVNYINNPENADDKVLFIELIGQILKWKANWGNQYQELFNKMGYGFLTLYYIYEGFFKINNMTTRNIDTQENQDIINGIKRNINDTIIKYRNAIPESTTISDDIQKFTADLEAKKDINKKNYLEVYKNEFETKIIPDIIHLTNQLKKLFIDKKTITDMILRLAPNRQRQPADGDSDNIPGLMLSNIGEVTDKLKTTIEHESDEKVH